MSDENKIVEDEVKGDERLDEAETKSDDEGKGVLYHINERKVEQSAKKAKKRKLAKLISLPIVGVLVFIFVLNIVILPLSGGCARVDKVLEYSGDNQYMALSREGGTMLSAHRAGGDLEPEETMAAFKLCMEAQDYRVDIVEFDVHLTKDGHLVLMHDHEVDRTSDGAIVFGQKGVKIHDKTLDELKQLNFGYNFYTEEDGYKYRDKSDEELVDVRILPLNDILAYLESARPDKSLNYIIEIKDDDEIGKVAMDKLVEAMETYDIIDRTIVGTFHGKITKYIDTKYSDKVKRSASIMEVINFYFAFLWGRDISKVNLGYDVLQIPMGLDGFFDFSTAEFIDYAHHYDIAVQYWTINDADDVKKLMNNRADAIMTDNPAMASVAMGRTV